MNWLSDRRRNPNLAGEDLTQAGQVAVGIGLSGYLSNKIALPLLSGLWTGMATANNPMAQLVSAGSTFAAGLGIAALLRFAGMPRFAKNAMFGSAVFATAKVGTMLIPDFALDSKFPEIPGISGFGDRWNPKPVAPPAAAMQLAPPTPIRRSATGL